MFMCVHVWMYYFLIKPVCTEHVCVCERKRDKEREGAGLMPCCQRTPDDEVLKP